MQNKKKLIALIGFIILLFLVPVFISSGYIIQSLIMVLLYAYWASSWNIIGGYGGQLSIGHATYVGVGAYVTAIMFTEYSVSPWLGMIFGGLIAALLSLIIGFPCFKLKGSYFTLSTVALANVIKIIFLQEDKILGHKTNGAMGVKIPWYGGAFMDIQFMDKRAYYLIILVLLIIVTLVSWKIKNSKTGYYLAAINTNQNAASSLGVNVQRFKLKAMFISAFLTAIGGGFYASLIQFIDPERLLGYTLSVEIMTLAVVGGRGTLFGPIVGAFIMVPISEFLRSYLGTSLSGISNIMYGLILMSIVFFMPGGLATMFKKIGDKLFKSKKHSKEEVSQNV